MKKLFVSLVLLVVCVGCCGGPKEIARVPYGDGHCILLDNGWVVVETTGGRDMIPVILVSNSLVEAFAAQLDDKNPGQDKNHREAK